MASHVPLRYLTHQQKLCNLYKEYLRNLESWHTKRLDYRYQAVLARDKFDQYMKINDPEKLTKVISDVEEELFLTQHYQPKMFANSVRGNAYGREAHIPDVVLDHWHPLEKAQYPEYFATREKRKEEFVRMWEKEFSKRTRQPSKKKMSLMVV